MSFHREERSITSSWASLALLSASSCAKPRSREPLRFLSGLVVSVQRLSPDERFYYPPNPWHAAICNRVMLSRHHVCRACGRIRGACIGAITRKPPPRQLVSIRIVASHRKIRQRECARHSDKANLWLADEVYPLTRTSNRSFVKRRTFSNITLSTYKALSICHL